jgi:hypothetical protein
VPETRALSLTWRSRRRAPGHDPPMVKLIYQMLVKLLSWMALNARSETAKEIEILVLRHQPAALQRRTPRPRLNWSDRAVIAALTRLLPARRRSGFLVAPSTILHWHRQLVRHRWTHGHASTGRTAPCSRPHTASPSPALPSPGRPPTPSCAGIAASSGGGGPTRTDPDGHRSTTVPPCLSCGWQRRTRTGDTEGCAVRR